MTGISRGLFRNELIQQNEINRRTEPLRSILNSLWGATVVSAFPFCKEPVEIGLHKIVPLLSDLPGPRSMEAIFYEKELLVEMIYC